MLYEVLKTAKIGAGQAPDLYTALLAKNLRRDGEVKTLSGAPPLSFQANGQPLLDYLIEGNTVQSGTPTPASPVDVQGVGTLDNGNYKIPISSASTTTPVYLGEVETTRKIKKLVFDGTEDWKTLSNGFAYLGTITDYSKINGNISICTHFITNDSVTSAGDAIDGVSFYNAPAENYRLYIKDSTLFTTITSLKSWLAEQYTNGTPVTIWYVLSSATTGVVNEPLRKIGTYADTVSMAQAGVEIPTARGTNTLDVLTDVKPSEVYIKYKE